MFLIKGYVLLTSWNIHRKTALGEALYQSTTGRGRGSATDNLSTALNLVHTDSAIAISSQHFDFPCLDVIDITGMYENDLFATCKYKR